MSFSFINPFVDGKIWSPEFGSIDLALIGDNKLPYVSSVEIKYGTGMNFEVTVGLDPTYDAAIDLIDNQPWIRLGNTLGIRWGYNDGNPAHRTDWIYTFMGLPEVSFGEEISVTLNGLGAGDQLTRSESTRVWKGRRLVYIFEKMAQKYGLVVNWDKVISGAMYYFERDLDYTQGGLTDYQFIDRYCRACISDSGSSPVAAVYYGKELHLISYSHNKPQPAAEFHMYGKPDPANNIFPMHTFDPQDWGALFLPHKTFGAIVFGPNTDPAEDVKKVDSVASKGDVGSGTDNSYSGKETLHAPGVNIDPNPDSKLKADAEQERTVEVGKLVPIIMSESETDEEVQGQVSNIRQQDAGDFGVSVNFTAMAIPTLLPMQYVRLKGVSAFFSTDYQLKDFSVTIDDNGAEMSVENAWATGLPEGMSLSSVEAAVSEQGETEPPAGDEEVQPDPDAGE